MNDLMKQSKSSGAPSGTTLSTGSELLRFTNWINGERRDPASGQWLEKVNPATGEVLGQVAASEFFDLVGAVQAANKAAVRWSKTEVLERAELLDKIAEAVDAKSEAFIRAQVLDEGATITQAKTRSFPRMVAEFRRHAGLLRLRHESPVLFEGSKFHHATLPIGVVGILTPWADSGRALASRVAAALAAGNCVIAKPSEIAPMAADLLCEVAHAAGLPPGVFNLLQGRGVEAGAALVQHPGISTLSFMGRSETAQTIAGVAAEFSKKVHFALGARNPVLVFASADLDRLMPRLVDLTMNHHGSTCMRGSRLFVQDPIYKDFLERYKTEIEARKVGDPMSPETFLGPLPSAEEARRFKSACSLAVKDKGRVLTGDASNSNPELSNAELTQGYFVRPSVFQDLTLCSTLQQDEVIGPFVSVSSFKYQHDAVKQANTSPLGQAAYVFEADADKAVKIASKLEFGRVFVNSTSNVWDDRVSFGPLKNSGFGLDGGDELMKFFSRRPLVIEPADF